MASSQVCKPNVYGTGLISLDIIVSDDPKQDIRACTGGTCGNVLTILSFLGWNAYPIARLNGDVASIRVKNDMLRWGVHLDFAECKPTASTPIIVQKISRDKSGNPKHSFVWSCPKCGNWLPRFKPVTVKGIDSHLTDLNKPKVFFMDRLSRSSLLLAHSAAEKGAAVFFEPSSKQDPKLLREALGLSHIVKYSDQRMDQLDESFVSQSTIKLEIQTLGSYGLRFRSRLPNAKTKGWITVPALRSPIVADTCGAGDWCTAGLIHKIGHSGQAYLNKVKRSDLNEALRYGQALAAWTCGFEGARGGMYGDITKRLFDKQIEIIYKGNVESTSPISLCTRCAEDFIFGCPACSPA